MCISCLVEGKGRREGGGGGGGGGCQGGWSVKFVLVLKVRKRVLQESLMA